MLDAVLAVLLIVCLITDIRERKIYNIVLGPVLIFGLIYNLITGGWSGLSQSLLGFLVGLALLLIPYAFGGMGAGDVKLLAVIGALKGPLFVLYSAFGMGLAGGVMSLAILLYHRRLWKLFADFGRGVWLMISSRFKVFCFASDNERIMFPYGVAIVAGAVCAFCWMG